MLALEPNAYGAEFSSAEPSSTNLHGAAVIEVRGPIVARALDDPFCVSFEWIVDAVDAATSDGSRLVFLRIASPGGVATGAFEAARAIRALSDERQARLIAHADGDCCSAAYALAAACHRVFASDTALIGSIGVAAVLADQTAADAAEGLAFRIVTSGARKGDGNPHASADADAVAALQHRVDLIASLFCDHVSAYRPITAEAVRALEADTFLATEAQALGLIDGVCDWRDIASQLQNVARAHEHTTRRMKSIELRSRLLSKQAAVLAKYGVTLK
jgi:ClpP class serine protease